MFSPIGSAPPNSFLRTVSPMTQTALPPRISPSVKTRPVGELPVARDEIVVVGAGRPWSMQFRAAEDDRDVCCATGATARMPRICVAHRLDIAPLNGWRPRWPPGPNWPGRTISRLLPRLADLGRDLRGGAVAEGHHGDHGGDADDDAEHGQERAQHVAADCPQGERAVSNSIRRASLSCASRFDAAVDEADDALAHRPRCPARA